MTAELIKLQARHLDLVYSAHLEPPAFDLAARWVELQSALYSHFSPYKLRLTDMKVESSGPNPADIAIACWMLSYGLSVRFRLDKVEVWSNSTRLVTDKTLVSDLVQHAMEALRAASPEARIHTHSLVVALHGAHEKPSPVVRVTEFVTKTPPGAPELSASGVSFFCQLPSGNGVGSIILEHSGLVQDGTFIRISSEQAGSVPVRDALGKAIEFFQAAVERLGFEMVWES